MKILLLGSVALSVPPPTQGGTEWISYYQATGLSEKGHQVTLIAAKGTKEHFKDTSVSVTEVGAGDVVTGSKNALSFDPKTMEASRILRTEMVYLGQVSQILIDEKDNYDVILNNMRGEAIFLPVAKMLHKPLINVLHLNLFPALAEIFALYKTPLIPISNAQKKTFPNLNFLQTVYNGVDIKQYPFSQKAAEYLLMVGSIGKHKNQEDAIAVAKKTGMKLILIGKIRDQDYFEYLKKDIDGKQIEWLGEVNFAKKVELYQNAKALLFPIQWEEPFGLVMIESMSCGTPVIAYNKGAVPEVIKNGETGFIVENIETMKYAVNKINNINRAVCREHVEKNFTVEKMVDGYEIVCKEILNYGR